MVGLNAQGELPPVNIPQGKTIAISRFNTPTTDQEMTDPGAGNEPRQQVEVTKLLYDKKSDRYLVTLKSNPGETYGIFSADDSGGFRPCIAPAVKAHPTAKETRFGPFPNPHPGKGKLSVQIGLPDLDPPAIERVWGNNSTISIDFTEPMMPTPSTAVANHTVVKDDGAKVAVTAAAFQPTNDTIVLTTAKPLDADANYTVIMRDLTERACRTLDNTAVANFRTWVSVTCLLTFPS